MNKHANVVGRWIAGLLGSIITGVVIFYLTEGRIIFTEEGSRVETSRVSDTSPTPSSTTSSSSDSSSSSSYSDTSGSADSTPEETSITPSPPPTPSPGPITPPTSLPSTPPSESEETKAPLFFMTRLVNESDLHGKSMWELDIMRNEIYARYGRRFQREDLQEYFTNQSWYTPKYFPDEFPYEVLTSIQKENAAFIREYQN